MRHRMVNAARSFYHGLIAVAAEHPRATPVLVRLIGTVSGAFNVFHHWPTYQARAAQACALGWPGSRFGFVVAHAFTTAFNRIYASLLYHAPERWDEFVAVRNLDAVKSALAQGRGAVIVGTHADPWITPLLFHLHGIPAATYANADRVAGYRNPRGNSAVESFIARHPFIITGKERELFRYLEKGEAVIFYPDVALPPSKRTLEVEIRGNKRHLSALPFSLGVPAVLMSLRCVGFGRFEYVFEEIAPSLSPRAAMDSFVAMLADNIDRELPAWAICWAQPVSRTCDDGRTSGV